MMRKVARWIAACLPCLGLLLVAAAAHADTSSIYVTGIDGSQPRMLARVNGHKQHEFPRWSHDGKMVAFNAQRNDESTRRIFLINSDGTGLRELGLGSMPTWSPDDKQLAFYVFGDGALGQIAFQNIHGTDRAELRLGRSPRWSPDGGHMAMTDGRNVIMIDMQTGQAAPLLPTPYFEVFRGFDFSPDGRRLAVTIGTAAGAKRQLLIVDTTGAARGINTRLKSNLGGVVSFSPDGKRLVYSSDYKLYTIEVDGAANSKMVPGQRGRNHHPHWSPDGESLVFVNAEPPK